MLHQALDVTALAARAFLACILVVAGIAKLADGEGFAVTLTQLGVATRQERLSRITAHLIPLVELGLGFLVVSSLWPIVADILMLGLFIGFNGVIAFALRKAPGATCRCFGALSNAQFNQKLFIRGLTVIALLVLAAGLSFSLAESSPWLVAMMISEYSRSFSPSTATS